MANSFSGMNDVDFPIVKKLHNINKNVLDHCKIETCIYISVAIDTILVAGQKHASYFQWVRADFLGPKLQLPRSSA